MPPQPTDDPATPAASPLAGVSSRARSLWAKSGDETGWLSLPQHMVDSAGVAARLWEYWASASLRASCARACHLGVEETGILLSWLAGTHDIGKACRRFQTQIDGVPEYAAFAGSHHGQPPSPHLEQTVRTVLDSYDCTSP